VIKVLQNWQEVQSATLEIQRKGLPLHLDIHKNWDHLLLHNLIERKGKHSSIVDLGCGECCTLNFFDALGFKNISGIDLNIERNGDTTYSLYQGDLTKTSFISGSVDVAVSISVIEHSVDLPAFFAEAARLLKVEGLLFITTDYWEKPLEIDSYIKPFGLEWQVFSQADIEQLIAVAKEYNLVLEQDKDIPACLDKPIAWYNYKYTFIALLFRKIK
jgi:SAM-dependent methyltransferase